jgi:hypothetical protein
LAGVASPALTNLSSRVERETPLIDGMRLSIKLLIEEDRQWLRMSLEDELNLSEVWVDYPILCPTLDRRYHLREATVIGLRRLVGLAFENQLISDSPGELMSSQKSQPAQAAPMPTHSEEDFSPSLTDLGSL